MGIPGWHETVLASRGQTGAKLWNCRTPSHTLPRGQGDCGGRSFCQPDADSTSGPGPATQQPATQLPATQLPATQLPATQQPATQQPATLSPSATRANAPSSTSCSTNFGPVPGFYESGDRKYVAIQHSQHVSQANFPDLISAAACLTSRTSCQYTTGTYGLRLTGSQQNPGYQNNDQAHTCLNDLTGTTNFYQRTANGYSYIFATSDSAMTSLNTALSA